MKRSRKGGAQRHYCQEPGCGKSFARQDHLYRHAANHNPQRLVHCPECGRSFARRDVLAAHMKKHDVDAAPTTVERSPSPDPVNSAGSQTAPRFSEPNEIGSSFLDSLPADLDSLYSWLMSDSGTFDTHDAAFSSTINVETPIISEDSERFAFDAILGSQQTPAPPVQPLHRDALLAYLFIMPDLATSPHFSCEALTFALDSYWSYFHPQIPLLHRPTFEPAASTALFAAMVAVGLCLVSTASEEDASYAVGFAVYRHLRPLILLHDAQSTPVSLETFQALFILGQAGQMLLDQGQHDLSYAFSAFEVTLGRSMDCFSHRFFQKQAALLQTATGTEDRWHAWVRTESWRRLSFAVLMRDTQLCTLFGHLPTRALSILLVRVGLPADETHWSAGSAAAWIAQPPPRELPLPQILKQEISSTNTPQYATTPFPPLARLNAFAQLCCLHGLLSIAWDIRWRGSLRSAAIESVQTTWRQTLERIYSQYRQRLLSMLDSPFTSSSDRVMCLTSLDVLLVGELELLMDVSAIQTFAGTERVAARTVGPEDFTVAAKYVRKWAATDEALQAVTLASEYLSRRITDADLAEGWTASKGMHAAWPIHLASITIWTFATLRHAPSIASSSTSVPPRLTPLDFVQSFPAEYDSAGLSTFVAGIAAMLECQRWGVGQQCGTLLRGLLSRRL
ncbi:hypothetical protein JCM5296_000736 [Sporobolomyces johnsonii]